ncbi:MAG: hypothetical protein LIO46_02850 [Clostridiales bacterium]|nr:hypothetical protein [Clostridiales bacterium]
MSFLDEKLHAIEACLRAREAFEQTVILSAYPAQQNPSVLSRPRIALSLRELTLGERMLDRGDRIVDYRVAVDLYLPGASGAGACNALYGEILDALASSSTFCMTQAQVEPVDYNRTMGAYVMAGTVRFQEVASDENNA